MKKIKILLTALVFTTFSLAVSAQDITVAEPDTASADLVYWVTPANELKAIPLETGSIDEHQNKFGKLAKIAGNVAEGVGAIGGIGTIIGANAGSYGTVLSGISVMGTASNVADLAGVTNALAGAEGHDFTYKPNHSAFVINNEGKDLNILANIKCENKEAALAAFKVVRFNDGKKDRRLRWLQTKAALIDTEKAKDADKAGYLSFGYKNYGEHSTLLTIPAAQLKKGEYGVYFLGNMFAPNLAILCYTFSIQ